MPYSGGKYIPRVSDAHASLPFQPEFVTGINREAVRGTQVSNVDMRAGHVHRELGVFAGHFIIAYKSQASVASVVYICLSREQVAQRRWMQWQSETAPFRRTVDDAQYKMFGDSAQHNFLQLQQGPNVMQNYCVTYSM